MLITRSVNSSSSRACVRGHSAPPAHPHHHPLGSPPKKTSKMMEMPCRGQGGSTGMMLGIHSPIPDSPAQPPASLGWVWSTPGEGNADGGWQGGVLDTTRNPCCKSHTAWRAGKWRRSTGKEAEGWEMVAKEWAWHCPVQPGPSWLFSQLPGLWTGV